MTEESKDLMLPIATTVLGILTTWFGKDKIAEAWSIRVNGKVAEKKADSEIKVSEAQNAIDSLKEAINEWKQLVEVKKQEAHECNEKLELLSEKLDSMEAKFELYRKRVIDLEEKYGAA